MLVYADKLIKIFLNGKSKIKVEAGDIVHSVIMKLLTGKRKWDFEKYPDFNVYMYMLIKSEICNVTCYERKFVDIKDYGECDENIFEEFIDRNKNLTLDEILSDKDAEELKERCLKMLSGDEDAAIVFLECIEGGNNKEIANRLGVKILFVENAKKRIRRKLNNLFFEKN
jgi:RNA polymerase sigma factor (sigma-70 family)